MSGTSDEESPPSERKTCIDCGAISPETDTSYTLIGPHGWRVVRRQAPEGFSMEWRCPACWEAYKLRLAEAGEPPPSSDGTHPTTSSRRITR